MEKSDPWWKGETFEDLAEYLRAFTETNYPAERVDQSGCRACGALSFTLHVDDEQGCAQRRCIGCGLEAFIADSEEWWEDADVADAACLCQSETFEVGVAFSLREDGEIHWVTVGGRCTTCGVLGVYTDWKIDYSPTDHLFALT